MSNGRIGCPTSSARPTQEATAQLNQAGWTTIERREEMPPDDFEPGTVFRTDPTAGSAVAKDADDHALHREGAADADARPRRRRPTTAHAPSPTGSPTSTAG